KVVMVKRVVAGCFAAGVAGALSACIAESPVVGSEVGGVDGSGTIALVGSVRFRISTMAADPFSEFPPLCMGGELPMNAGGTLACNVLSARVPESGECSCEAPRRAVSSELRRSYLEALDINGRCGFGTGVDCAALCICEEPRAVGASANDCLNNRETSESSTGWCYVDPSRGIGAPALVADCPARPAFMLRVLDIEPDTTYGLACAGGMLRREDTAPGSGATGDSCLPSQERRVDFQGFALQEVTLDLGTPECQTNLCLVNHFQGRASCPYGQASPLDADTGPKCFLPGEDAFVDGPVDPQLVERRADDNAICSCRCDGPGPGPFCTCPEGMRCEPLIPGAGVPGEDEYVGSFCINAGTRYDPTQPPAANTCTTFEMNCGEPRPY
ncbi:MAG TPA: hypothetical protein VFZ53_17305, partial [Polyangiaceae bacterium]